MIDQSNSSLVGIVLVNYNGLKFMSDCLESLARIDYPAARIVVVDNASTDGSVEWVAAHYPNIVLLPQGTNRGITGGNNAGIQWCLENACDHVLLLNNDTVVELDFLSRLMAHAEPDCMLVPKIYFHDNKALINNHLGGYDYRRGLHRDWFYGKVDSSASRKVQYAAMANTCALLLPAETFQKTGMMDETFFMYSDDTDFITRAVRQGTRIKFVPDAVLYHRESSSSGGTGSPLSVYYTNRNRLYFMFKHQKNRAALLFFIVYFGVTRVLVALHYLLRGKRVQLFALIHAVADFCQGHMGYASPARFQ